MTFTPGGDKPWIDGGTVGGKAAVKSGLEDIDDSQSSVLTATFSGAGTLSFSYIVSSEGNYDWLIVEVDGEQVVKTSGYDVASCTKCEKALAAGFALSVVASDALDGTSNAATYPLEADGTTLINETVSGSRFFRLKAVEE